MNNFLGKLMVQFHFVICMMALGWAASMYFDPVDLGWKTPRIDLGSAVASEFDKMTVKQKDAMRWREQAYVGVKDAWAEVRKAEEFYYQNKLAYEKDLARLRSDPSSLKDKVKELTFTGDGALVLETAGSKLGKPIFDAAKPISEIEKSYESYFDELKNLHLKARLIEKEYTEWQRRQNKSIEASNGEDGKPGLNKLRELEVDLQTQILEEIRYLEPREIDFRKEAEIFKERRDLLEQDKLRALKGYKKRS